RASLVHRALHYMVLCAPLQSSFRTASCFFFTAPLTTLIYSLSLHDALPICMHKTFKTFLFFTRKKKQKNLTSATSAKGGFALVARLKKTRDRSYFSKRCAEKSPP